MKPKTVPIAFRVPVETKVRLEAKAAEAGTNLNRMLQAMVDELLSTMAASVKKSVADFDELTQIFNRYHAAIKKGQKLVKEEIETFEATREQYIDMVAMNTAKRLGKEAVARQS